MEAEPYRSTHYHSGETIRAGDRVTLAGSPGIVEFVLGCTPPPECEMSIAWYRERFKHGFMIRTERWGPLFQALSDDDLVLVKRATLTSPSS